MSLVITLNDIAMRSFERLFAMFLNIREIKKSYSKQNYRSSDFNRLFYVPPVDRRANTDFWFSEAGIKL